MVELSSGLQKTNPASGMEEDLNPGPPGCKFSALTTRPRHLLNHKELDFKSGHSELKVEETAD